MSARDLTTESVEMSLQVELTLVVQAFPGIHSIFGPVVLTITSSTNCKSLTFARCWLWRVGCYLQAMLRLGGGHLRGHLRNHLRNGWRRRWWRRNVCTEIVGCDLRSFREAAAYIMQHKADMIVRRIFDCRSQGIGGTWLLESRIDNVLLRLLKLL